MERLTREWATGYSLTKEYIDKNTDFYEIETSDGYDVIKELNTDEAIKKLGQLEDIIEKYNIEDLDTLDRVVFIGKMGLDAINQFPKWEAVDLVKVDKLMKDKGE